jgi:hypothetical protein
MRRLILFSLVLFVASLVTGICFAVTFETHQLTNNNTIDESPSLYSGAIAWQQWDGTDSEIYYWDGNNTIQITDNNTDDWLPSLYNGTIAWHGWDGNDFEIYYWDGVIITQVTDNNADEGRVSLWRGTIAWDRFDGNDTEIYYAETVSPFFLGPPIVGDLLQA